MIDTTEYDARIDYLARGMLQFADMSEAAFELWFANFLITVEDAGGFENGARGFRKVSVPISRQIVARCGQLIHAEMLPRALARVSPQQRLSASSSGC